jgi:amino acid permease
MVTLMSIPFTNHPGPIVNGINGFGQVFVLASAYYVGTEIISLAAGETKDPRRSIPTVRHTFIRAAISADFNRVSMLSSIESYLSTWG